MRQIGMRTRDCFVVALGIAAIYALLVFCSATLGPSQAKSNPCADPIICPLCQKEGRTSRVFKGTRPGRFDNTSARLSWRGTIGVGGGSTGASTVTQARMNLARAEDTREDGRPADEPDDFFDEAGCEHHHGASYDLYWCSFGHNWERITAHCSVCGWPNYEWKDLQ